MSRTTTRPPGSSSSPPLAPDQIKALRAEHGLALVDFIPESAYIERIPAEAALALREHELVRTVVAYGADLKVSRTVDAVRRNRKDDDDSPWA